MKRFTFVLWLIVVAVVSSGVLAGAQDKKDAKASSAQTEVKTTYSCPMHPDVVSAEPGKCPKCGMNLTAVKGDTQKADVQKADTGKADSTASKGHEGHATKGEGKGCGGECCSHGK